MEWPWSTHAIREAFQDRAQVAFSRRERDIDAALDVMMADHSAKGRLQSGATIIAAFDIFETQSAAALDRTLVEAAKVVEHRGRKWKAAMRGIYEALDVQLSEADRHVAKVRRVADRNDNAPSISRAIDERLAEIRAKLHEQLSDFSDGWTAPVAKPWQDRHRFLYAVGLLIAGALVGAIVKALFSGTPPVP